MIADETSQRALNNARPTCGSGSATSRGSSMMAHFPEDVVEHAGAMTTTGQHMVNMPISPIVTACRLSRQRGSTMPAVAVQFRAVRQPPVYFFLDLCCRCERLCHRRRPILFSAPKYPASSSISIKTNGSFACARSGLAVRRGVLLFRESFCGLSRDDHTGRLLRDRDV